MTASHVGRAAAPVAEPRFAVVVVGVGNIGSHVVPLLARLAGIGRLTIVDRDVYEPKNLAAQAIGSGDVGKPKASVQAARARRLAPGLDVRAIVGDVAALPFGAFRANLVLGCLDSRAARQRLGEITFRMGTPYLDAGVDAGALLARLHVYDSRADGAPCIACSWGAADLAAVADEQAQSCSRGSVMPPPATNAPAALGALAAALLVLECEKRLRGQDPLPPGTELMIDSASHASHVTHERRNPACGFDHERWEIERLGRLPSTLSLEALLTRTGASKDDATLAVAGERFVTQVACAACGTTRPLVRLGAALRQRDRICLVCSRPTAPRGWDLAARIDVGALAPAARRRPLRTLGLRRGDVVTIARGDDVHHYELS